MLSRRNLPLLLVLLAICLVYANSFSNSFHFDDFHTIVDNPAIRSPVNLRRIFTDTTAFSVLPANQTYRPVVTASLALDYALGHGYSPFWFHLSTLLWFLLLVSVLFRLFELLLDRVHPDPANWWLALGVATWYGLHPAMAETVNYVIQRGDLYCTLGCVVALYVFARYPRRRRYGLYLIPLILAMLSKPPAAVFPVLLFLYILFFEASTLSVAQRWRAGLVAGLPSIVTTGALLSLQAAMTPKTFLPSIISPTDYRLTQPFVWMRYCGALFLPLHLNADTDLQPFSSFRLATALGLVFVLAMVLLIAYTSRRRRLYPVAFGLLWFVITQLPTSLYPLSEVENDHRMFFSFPGLMLAVVWGAYLGYEHLQTFFLAREDRLGWLRPVTCVAAAVCLCGYAWGAHRRNQVWRSEDTLWADDALKSPHNGRGLMIYGLTRMNAGDLQGALALFQRAILYTPNYATLEINLGVVNGLLAGQGHPELNAVAEQHFARAVALAPNDDSTHTYYGRWLLGQRRLIEARSQLGTAVALNPHRAMQRDLLMAADVQVGNASAARRLALETVVLIPDDVTAAATLHGNVNSGAPSPAAALINASLASYRAGRYKQSIVEAKQALLKDAYSAEAWNNIGAGYGALHQWDLGIAAEQQALKLNADLEIAQNNLRWLLAQKAGGGTPARTAVQPAQSAADYVNLSLTLNQQARYVDSIAAARKALAIDPHSAEAWNNIAADEAALHQREAAIEAAEKAVALNPDFQLAKNNLAWALQQRGGERKP